MSKERRLKHENHIIKAMEEFIKGAKEGDEMMRIILCSIAEVIPRIDDFLPKNQVNFEPIELLKAILNALYQTANELNRLIEGMVK